MSHNPQPGSPGDWTRYLGHAEPAAAPVETFDRARPLARLRLSPDGDDNRIAPAWFEVLADNSPGERLGFEQELACFAYVAASPWAPQFFAALRKNREASVYAVRDPAALGLAAVLAPAPHPTLLVVEDLPTRDALRRATDCPDRLWVTAAMGGPGDLRGARHARFANIYVRYPSLNWFTRRRVSEEQFSTWVRMEVAPRLIRGGDFQYI